MSYQQNHKIWWPFAKKTSITLKSFKNQLTIKVSSLEPTPLVTKFSWIANTSNPNATENLKSNSLDCSEFYIQ